MSFAICASSRIASSVRCISSVAVGRSLGSVASIGFGIGLRGRRAVELRHQLPRLALRAPRPSATRRSGRAFGALLRQHGQRRFRAAVRVGVAAAVEIAPARGCRPSSASIGDFALTSATSSGGPRSSIFCRSNGWNLIASSTAWITIEMPSVYVKSRPPRRRCRGREPRPVSPSRPRRPATPQARQRRGVAAVRAAGGGRLRSAADPAAFAAPRREQPSPPRATFGTSGATESAFAAVRAAGGRGAAAFLLGAACARVRSGGTSASGVGAAGSWIWTRRVGAARDGARYVNVLL